MPSLHGDAFYWFASQLRKAAKARRYRNFAWVMQWDVTYVCPLTCSYCAVPHYKEHGDSARALRQVLELRPKVLTITGGEPILEPNIVSLARTVKETYNPLVLVTTSLMGKDETIRDLIPWIDVLHVSLDGLGEYNKLNRGYGSSSVLKKLAMAAEIVREGGYNKSILVLCVLTPHNAKHVRELVETVAALDPDNPHLWMAFSTVEPPTHPLSLVQHPELLDETVRELVQLQEDHNVILVGPLATRDERLRKTNPDLVTTEFTSTERKHGNGAYYCPRQYFRVMMDPDGELRSCKDGRLLEDSIRAMEKSLREKHFWRAARDFWYIMDILFIHPNSAECRFPCKCEEFVDDVIMSREGEPPTRETGMLTGRFASDELDAAELYIKRNFNPRWNSAVKEMLRTK